MGKIKLSEKHVHILKHALGLDQGGEAFRNYYLIGEGHEKTDQVLELVSMGLMQEQTTTNESVTIGNRCFDVTMAGRKALSQWLELERVNNSADPVAAGNVVRFKETVYRGEQLPADGFFYYCRTCTAFLQKKDMKSLDPVAADYLRHTNAATKKDCPGMAELWHENEPHNPKRIEHIIIGLRSLLGDFSEGIDELLKI